MALGSLNVRVSKRDFLDRIQLVEQRMAVLQDVIDRYGRAKTNLDQFMTAEDSNTEEMLKRIDENVKAAKAAYNSLNETKVTLQETVDNMDEMGKNIKDTISSASEAAASAIGAALNVNSLL